MKGNRVRKRAAWKLSMAWATLLLASVAPSAANAQAYDPLTISGLLFFIHSSDATNGRSSPTSGSDDHITPPATTGSIQMVSMDDSTDLDALCQQNPAAWTNLAGETVYLAGDPYGFRVTSSGTNLLFFSDPTVRAAQFPNALGCYYRGWENGLPKDHPHGSWSLSGSTSSVTDQLNGLVFNAPLASESSYPSIDTREIQDHKVWAMYRPSTGAGKAQAALQHVDASANGAPSALEGNTSFTLWFFGRFEAFGSESQTMIQFRGATTTNDFITFGGGGSAAGSGMRLRRKDTVLSQYTTSGYTRDNDFHLYSVTYNSQSGSAEFFEDGASKGVVAGTARSPAGLETISVIGNSLSGGLNGVAFIGGVGASTSILSPGEQGQLHDWYCSSFDNPAGC